MLNIYTLMKSGAFSAGLLIFSGIIFFLCIFSLYRELAHNDKDDKEK